MISYSCTIVLIHATRYTLAYSISCASRQARGKFDRMKWRSAAETTPCAYPIHGSASEVNCSGTDTQVVSCHGYFVVYSVHVKFVQSEDYTLQFRMQPQDSENVQRNLKIAQILRLRRTSYIRDWTIYLHMITV